MALAVLLLVLAWLRGSLAFVIAPPWANPLINPCSEKSWQLIYWPQDGRCYQIFEQGPCPDTQELAFHATNKRVSALLKIVTKFLKVDFLQAICRCPKNLLYWPATDRCYPQHSRGPCEANQYLQLESESQQVICQQTKICENGWIFWPPMQDCFQLYTQGPCHKVNCSFLKWS